MYITPQGCPTKLCIGTNARSLARTSFPPPLSRSLSFSLSLSLSFALSDASQETLNFVNETATENRRLTVEE